MNTPTSSTGPVSEGYLSGATVFADLNTNGIVDAGETTTSTDASGNYSIDAGGAPLTVIGGIDISTGLPFEGILRGLSSGTGSITPLTTIIAALADLGATDPEGQVAAAFGITGEDFENTDPITAILAGSAGNFAGGAQVYNAVSLIASLISGASGTGIAAASIQVFDAIAAAINALPSGNVLDLTDATIVATIIDTAATNSSATLNAADVSGAANIGAAFASAVNDAATATGSTQVLAEIVAIELVAQGDASTALEQIGAGSGNITTIEDSFTGTNLDGLITNAQSQTGDVDGPNIENPPVAVNDSATTDEDTATIITAAQLLANDTDADGDTLTITGIDTTGTTGTLTDNSDGTYSYNPNGAFEALNDGDLGSDSFTYTISDSNGGTSSATVNIGIDGVTDIISKYRSRREYRQRHHR